MTRECDNDNCDYETYVDSNGSPRARWVHVPECVPMDDLPITKPGEAPKGSFLEYLGTPVKRKS